MLTTLGKALSEAHSEDSYNYQHPSAASAARYLTKPPREFPWPQVHCPPWSHRSQNGTDSPTGYENAQTKVSQTHRYATDRRQPTLVSVLCWLLARVRARLPQLATVSLWRVSGIGPLEWEGTTTAACHRYGMSAVGYDLNPAMVIVAKARLLSSEVASSLKPLADELLVDLHAVEVTESEPLSQWFDPQSAALVRCLEQRIQLVLVGAEDDATVMPRQTSAVSSLAAFYYLALFRSVRHLVRPFLSSNPTWLRVSKAPEDRRWAAAHLNHQGILRQPVKIVQDPGVARCCWPQL